MVELSSWTLSRKYTICSFFIGQSRRTSVLRHRTAYIWYRQCVRDELPMSRMSVVLHNDVSYTQNKSEANLTAALTAVSREAVRCSRLSIARWTRAVLFVSASQPFFMETTAASTSGVGISKTMLLGSTKLLRPAVDRQRVKLAITKMLYSYQKQSRHIPGSMARGQFNL